MNIKKINTIKNVSRFANYTARGDVELNKCTLIFASNGRGKTSFCSILRSLQTGDSSHIVGRTTLGAIESPEVSLGVDAGTVTFADNVWSETMPDLAIFDSIFVSDNVYSGDGIEHEHKRKLYQVIVGEKGVELARAYETLDASIRDKNEEIRKARTNLQSGLPAHIALDDFIAMTPNEKIDEEISAKEKDLRAVKESTAIQRREPLSTLTLPVLPDNFESLLSKTIEGVAQNVGDKMTAHIATHNMRYHGEQWLSEGLEYLTNECPFCGQDIAGSALGDALKGFFSEAYTNLKDDLSDLRSTIENGMSDRIIGQIETVHANNATAVEFWNAYCRISPPTLGEVDASEALRTLRAIVLSLVATKERGVLEVVKLNDEFLTARESANKVAMVIDQYNAVVAEANKIIAGKKADTGRADESTIVRDLETLRAQKRRADETVKSECDLYTRLAKEKEVLEKEKNAAKTALDEYAEQVIKPYENSINQYLDHFGAGFRIGHTAHDYRGAGVPRSSFRIVINSVPVELGDATTPNDVPSFKNTLSSGDRSTLAFAFFLAQFERDPQKDRKIVVFDDPFTSQDSFRRTETVNKILKCGGVCAQVIVLSHDDSFLFQIWNKVRAADRRSLCFVRTSEDNTIIQPYDLERSNEPVYVADKQAMQFFYTNAEGNPREIGRKLRPTLESYLRRIAPGQFAHNDNLGAMLRKIRDGGDTHPLASLYSELNDINEYSTGYHHGEDPNAGTVQRIDDTELRTFVVRTLRLVEAI